MIHTTSNEWCVLIQQVQGYPLYHLVKGQTERQFGQLDDALASLQTAMNYFTTKKPAGTYCKL